MKYDLTYRKPLLNAAGTLGFFPDPYGPVDLARLGAFITNPISLEARTPANGTRFAAFPGGFLLHTGYPNPGLRAGLRHYASRWAKSPLPIIVHILCTRAGEVAEMVRRLENINGVMGIEIGVPPQASLALAAGLTAAAAGELPILVRLPFERALELAGTVHRSGAAAVSLGAARGAVPVSPSGFARGRLYGPALFPQALGLVVELAQAGIPVIGSGGIYQASQADAMLAAGAQAVQLDAVLWRGGLWPEPAGSAG